jgi:hypothetical protein
VGGFLRVLQSKCISPLLLHWAHCQSQLGFTVGTRYDLLFFSHPKMLGFHWVERKTLGFHLVERKTLGFHPGGT